MYFETLPLSAYALCYGPLALTIIGFIAFAYMTDVDARRTYLRDMDKRGDDELSPEEIEAKRERTEGKKFTAEVPSGDKVTIDRTEG